jgi:hypothetical protein
MQDRLPGKGFNDDDGGCRCRFPDQGQERTLRKRAALAWAAPCYKERRSVYNSIRPGQIWLDTEGKRIQAHGGSVFYLDGLYYWYGENKEKTDPEKGIWHWGVRCYLSKDLYNWDDQGLIIPPEPDDETSSLHPSAFMDRPHIIYNKRTRKFVCWLKIMHKDGAQTATVLTADHILGKYTKVRENIRPLGMNAGDFDLATSDDGKAYYYFERVHTETICADLTEDYADITGYYSTHFPRKQPPDVREAVAHFLRKGKHYLITSGTTGYLPNPSEIAIADTWHGPYKVLGNPHPNDTTNTSYYSQISSVFKVPGRKDLYIACADRWLPNEMHLKYEDYAEMFRRRFSGELSAELLARWKKYMPRENTAIADYVWIPFFFDGEKPFLEWRDEWRIEDYEQGLNE